MNSQEYWAHLGIEPSSDKKVIRSAFAKKLKTCRPEDDPHGYEALREAYQYCLEQSQRVDDIELETNEDAQSLSYDSNIENEDKSDHHSDLQNLALSPSTNNTENDDVLADDSIEKKAHKLSQESARYSNKVFDDWIESIVSALASLHQQKAIEIFDQQKQALIELSPSEYLDLQIDLVIALNDLEPYLLHPTTFYDYIADYFNWEEDYQLQENLDREGFFELKNRLAQYEINQKIQLNKSKTRKYLWIFGILFALMAFSKVTLKIDLFSDSENQPIITPVAMKPLNEILATNHWGTVIETCRVEQIYTPENTYKDCITTTYNELNGEQLNFSELEKRLITLRALIEKSN